MRKVDTPASAQGVCRCVYATARNTPAVRRGFEQGGYLLELCAHCLALSVKNTWGAPGAPDNRAPFPGTLAAAAAGIAEAGRGFCQASAEAFGLVKILDRLADHMAAKKAPRQ